MSGRTTGREKDELRAFAFAVHRQVDTGEIGYTVSGRGDFNEVVEHNRSFEEAVDLNTISERSYNSLIAKVLKQRSVENPAAAMDYAMSLQESEMKTQAVGTVMEIWAMKSPEESRR